MMAETLKKGLFLFSILGLKLREKLS